KSRRAHYALIESDAPAAAIHEMERRMRLSEDILRYLTVREEALSNGPSAILDRGSRDDYNDSNENSEDKDNKEAA
ncbi:MAG: 30S ribosomal protein S6, partial [Alphaproteobacteria bacterium]|nr:30S ribosomal protein S6 [Alphaproteobacteria bacterium]